VPTCLRLHPRLDPIFCGAIQSNDFDKTRYTDDGEHVGCVWKQAPPGLLSCAHHPVVSSLTAAHPKHETGHDTRHQCHCREGKLQRDIHLCSDRTTGQYANTREADLPVRLQEVDCSGYGSQACLLHTITTAIDRVFCLPVGCMVCRTLTPCKASFFLYRAHEGEGGLVGAGLEKGRCACPTGRSTHVPASPR
jgi:hypothetical protein